MLKAIMRLDLLYWMSLVNVIRILWILLLEQTTALISLNREALGSS